jgi:hypothetical protein
MTRYRCFAIACCTLAAVPACGPLLEDLDSASESASESGSESGSESASESAEGSTTAPIPQICVYGEEVFDDGEEFVTPDGCVTYRCEGGGLTVLVDERVQVAGDLALATQADVDQNICLSVVEGNLTISGSAADLTPLAQLTRVGGTFAITASEAVTTNGLQTLAEIGGSIVIADNAALTTLYFQIYMSVFGDVTIQNNDALASLAGAEFIGGCSTCASVVPSRDLTGPRDAEAAEEEGGAEPGGDDDGGADEEPQGGTFYGAILIADNDVLTDVTALGNLWYAWSHVRFRNNAVLTSLAGLPLTEVQGDLEITNHAAMSTVDAEAFAAGISVWGVTMVCGNQGGLACP